jgi:dipeptidyl aminopeptidase/acylaminoacyl peptidase
MKASFQIITVCFLGIFISLSGTQRSITFHDLFSMARVQNLQISPDGRWVVYDITFYDIEENSKYSNIYMVSVDGKIVKQLTFNKHANHSPLWVPGGSKISYISDEEGSSQIYLLNPEEGKSIRLTDIATTVESYAWSQDAKHLLVETKMLPQAKSPKESMEIEEKYQQDQGSGKEITKLLFRHWNKWRDGKFKHLLLLDKDGKFIRDLTPGEYDTPPISLGSKHDYRFSPDGYSFCFVKNSDPIIAISTNNDLWISSIDTVNHQKITRNKGNDGGPRYSPDGHFIAYLSMKREGFEADQRNIILYDVHAGSEKIVSEAVDRSVTDFVWSPDSKKLYFFVEHFGKHRLYQVELKNNKLTRLLENAYIDQIDISPDGRFLVLSCQSVNHPSELYRFDIKTKKLIQLTFTNTEILDKLQMNPLEEYWFIGANSDSIHLLMVKPPNFDDSRKYPLISLIHGGPQGAWRDRFHYRWNAEMFAAPGYVVIMINFHGSRGYGQAFCDAVSKNWGGWPYQDIMIGTKWAAENFNFIDNERIGAAGASYGGYMINWIEGHNEENLFKCLVSHAGVYELISDFGSTEETWFNVWEFAGYPWENDELYQKWNPANFVQNFKTPILVIQGEKDFRVAENQAFQLFTALQLKGVESKLLFFPDEDHWVRKPKNARQWWINVYQWLYKYLQP